MESAQNVYQYNVQMTCSGCSGAVSRILTKTPGVDKFEVNLEKQLVTVTASIPKEAVLEAIRKSGKPVTAL
ncbi:heavy metal-associated domain-containing protein [Polychytrium aggregatum]|uniref:heavy metal-associated domain-containing protein n=1 Tax=Polychytrium aggregatum TaxID=110093 RepID=UPI0022FDF847|nr:heavy metal-associated domain-containing protein [Polychytrium aggregatum]KAI9201879.1 heavy metal-associated domain-containing protein [Polychytrium aggregatum]